MPPSLPPEVRNAIIEDLREGRLSFEEIAAKRLGDGRKTGTISKIAKKEGLSRGVKTPSKRRAFQRDLSSQKAQSILKIKLESFGPDERLNLCSGPSGLSTVAVLWLVWPQEESAYRRRRIEAFKPKGWLLVRAPGPFWSDVSSMESAKRPAKC